MTAILMCIKHEKMDWIGLGLGRESEQSSLHWQSERKQNMIQETRMQNCE